MPHRRLRHIAPIFRKRLGLWPVLGLLGARQVGKSTLLRDQLAQDIQATYVTFDDKEIRARAQRKPGHFLSEHAVRHVIFDEGQKAPDLFDAIKEFLCCQNLNFLSGLIVLEISAALFGGERKSILQNANPLRCARTI